MSKEKKDQFELTNEELHELLAQKNAELSEVKEELSSVKVRSLKVYEENQLLQHSPQYAEKAAEMKYFIEVAKSFIKSGAFPGNATPEQLFVKIQAGKEMGMGPMEAVNSLYFVNGKLEPYGKGMVALLTAKGYRVSYQDEQKDRVTIVAVSPDGHEHLETAYASDPIIQRSKAAKISMRNKLRFHAARTLLNFQLPHLIRGASDLFEADALTQKGDSNSEIEVSDEAIKKAIEEAASKEDLNQVFEDNKSKISKDIVLLGVFQRAKKNLANGGE